MNAKEEHKSSKNVSTNHAFVMPRARLEDFELFAKNEVSYGKNSEKTSMKNSKIDGISSGNMKDESPSGRGVLITAEKIAVTDEKVGFQEGAKKRYDKNALMNQLLVYEIKKFHKSKLIDTNPKKESPVTDYYPFDPANVQEEEKKYPNTSVKWKNKPIPNEMNKCKEEEEECHYKMDAEEIIEDYTYEEREQNESKKKEKMKSESENDENRCLKEIQIDNDKSTKNEKFNKSNKEIENESVPTDNYAQSANRKVKNPMNTVKENTKSNERQTTNKCNLRKESKSSSENENEEKVVERKMSKKMAVSSLDHQTSIIAEELKSLLCNKNQVNEASDVTHSNDSDQCKEITRIEDSEESEEILTKEDNEDGQLLLEQIQCNNAVHNSEMSSKLNESSREIHMKALSELQTSVALRARPDVVYGTMIPEPDYSDDEGDKVNSSSPTNKMVSRNNRVNSNGPVNSPQKENKCENGRFDEKGLIVPKKLPNPCQESTDKKSLHKELMFNQKLGINVLNQKSELQKAMEKHKDKLALKEQEKEKQTQLTPLQKAMDERVQRLEKKQEEKEEPKEIENSSEFQKIHAKFRSKLEAK